MKKVIGLLLAVCGTLSMATAQTIDSKNSVVNFEIKNMKVRTVLGKLSNLSGAVNFKPESIEESSFSINIPLNTMDTKEEKRDEHLQAEEYFNTAQYPNMTFVSTGISKTTNGMDITGNLTIKGVSKSVSLPFTYEKTAVGYLLKSNFKLDRYDFNVGSDGSFAMGRSVAIEVEVFVKS